jgi:hypothetical protein
MAIRLKTIEYHLPTLNTLADNTLTALTQKTIYIPEGTGTIYFKSVCLMYSIEEGSAQPAGNYTTRRMTVSVNGATATNYANSNLYTGSGENATIYYSVDATAHFRANWGSATSRTLDVSVLLDGSATPSATPFVNVNVTVFITYEYNDTSSTQIKTVNIPLNTSAGTLGSTKSAVYDRIPDLDNYLPESSKSYRDIHITVQGNIGATTTDGTLSIEIDNNGAYTSQISERGGASDRWSRLVYQLGTTGMTTNAKHDLYLWSNQLTYNHQQVWMTVTYEFDATASSDTMVSIFLPTEIVSPMGGATSVDAQRAKRSFWAEESGIVPKRLAFYSFWDQAAAVGGLFWRIGTGISNPYVAYTDAPNTLCGGNGCMIRNDSYLSGAMIRGKNSLEVSVYRTDTADLGYNVGGYFLVNYQANKPDNGYGAANHTVRHLLHPFTGAAKIEETTVATGIDIPEYHHYLNALGTNYCYLSNTTSSPAGVTVVFEKPSGEGGLEWLPAYIDVGTTDPETGLRQCWSQVREYFQRFPDDTSDSRLDLTGYRRWRMVMNNAATAFHHLELYFTYHTITYNKTTTISDSNGGVVTCNLHRIQEDIVDTLLTKVRTGNGTIDWTWYDNTTGMYVTAYEDSTHVGRSSNFTF